MKIFAIADPHLSLGTPGKEMDKFGPHWRDHPNHMAAAWQEIISDDDIVLVAGDISWALRLDCARPDIEFLASLPGIKVMIKGNHDYWWQSISKLRAILPDRFFALQGDAVEVSEVVICGTRLWDVPGVTFATIMNRDADDGTAAVDESTAPVEHQSELDPERIYRREVERLKRSLAQAAKLTTAGANIHTVVMTHYPPCDAELVENELTALFERSNISHVVFGHLHNVRRDVAPFGRRNGISYHLTACDYLDFRPKLIDEV